MLSLGVRLSRQCRPQWLCRLPAALRPKTRISSCFCSSTEEAEESSNFVHTWKPPTAAPASVEPEKTEEPEKIEETEKTEESEESPNFVHTWKPPKPAPVSVEPEKPEEPEKTEDLEKTEDFVDPIWPSSSFGRVMEEASAPASVEDKNTEDSVEKLLDFGRVKQEAGRWLSEGDILASLDEHQRAAVIAPSDKPLYIQGAAGTGKTTVMLRRLLYLVTEKGVDPSSILVVCFSNKGVQDFRAGMKQLVPEFLPLISICTLQSLAKSILGRHYREAGFDSRPEVLVDIAKQELFARSAWFSVNTKTATSIIASEYPSVKFEMPEGPVDWENPEIEKFWKRIINSEGLSDCSPASRQTFFVSRCSFRFFLESAQFQEAMVEDRKKGLHPGSPEVNEFQRNAWSKYQQVLCANNYIDPDDTSTIVLQLLQKNPDVVNLLRGRFSHLLLHDLEDANRTELELLLSFNTPSISVAGDEDQNLYDFRVAVPDVFGVLKEKMAKLGFEEHTQTMLELNHRSSPQLLRFAGSLLKPVKTFKSVKPADHSSLQLSCYTDNSFQAEAIATKLLALHSGTSWSNCAILMRSERDFRSEYLQHIRDALSKYHIPFELRKSDSISFHHSEPEKQICLTRVEFTDLLAYLKLSLDPNDDDAFVVALARPPRQDLGKKSKFVQRVLEPIRESDSSMSLYQAAKKVLAEPPATMRVRAVEELRDVVERVIDGMQDDTLFTVEGRLERVIELLGYRERRSLEVRPRRRTKKKLTKRQREKQQLKKRPDPPLPVLKMIIDMAKLFDKNCTTKEHRVTSFIARIEQALAPSSVSKLRGAVTLSLIEYSKGYEWDNVFVPNFDFRLFPSTDPYQGFIEPKERQAAHVACTRARANLLLSKLDKPR